MSEPELTPDAEEQIRALLAGVRHTEPIPPEVAARMDEVLAGLARAADEPVPDPPVTPLPVRRHRRTGVLLAAACAVVVAGIGVRTWEGAGGGADSAGSSVASLDQTDRGAEAGDPQAGESEREQLAKTRGQGGHEKDGDRPAPDRFPSSAADSLVVTPEVHARTFARDARALAPVSALAAQPYAAKSVCPGSDSWGNGDRVSATYRGAAAVLVYRPAVDGTQQVDLFVCGEPEPVRSATIPAP